ncbi:MAG: uracil-DNA glycosylase [Candidatus Latescibacteria bacterium]|nr:uracil-DNA glycosylase [Candidatus Latescibacterota bacterium]
MTQDSPGRLAADLARYLDQQQQDGTAWYFDEGPVAAAAAATLADPPATPVEAATPAALTPPAAATAAGGPEADAAAAAKSAREREFRAECERFVRETLTQIRNRPVAPVAAAPAAPDLFAAAPAATPDGPPAAPAPVSKRLALESLAAEVAVCTACKLHPTRTQTVFGSGNPDARVLFIGEAPGRNEDEQGLPFVGRAGQLLTDILRAIRFERDEVYICNILKCRPPENRDPERDEADACEPFLRRQLAIIQPHLICCLGRHAAMTLLDTRASLRSLRETVHFYQGIPVLATFHPAALLRNPHWKRDTWEDVRKLRALHDALLADAS